MKKNLLTILTIFLIIIVILAYLYYNFQKKSILAQRENKIYKEYIDEAITGSKLMTLINKVSDKNEKNNIQKNENGRYIENDENSIKIQIKFLDSDNIFDMEAISKGGSEAFIKNYNSVLFKCQEVKYHDKTKQIKYMLFEET